MVSLRACLRRVSACPTVVVGLIFLSAATGWAQEGYRDHYREGREAFEAGDWKSVVESMRLALKERENERGRVLGTPLGRYVPRYYLGVALAELGRCGSALRIFEEAEEDGAITRISELHADLEAKRGFCLERIRALQQELRRGRSFLEEARSLGRSAADLAVNPILGTPEVEEGLRLSTERLVAAEAGLRAAAAAEDPAAAARAGTVARSVRSDLEDLIELMSSREAAAREFAEEKRDRVGDLARQGQLLLDRAQQLEPLPAPLAERVAGLERSLRRAANSEEAPLGALEDLERTLGRQVADLREALRSPPGALVAAAQAYLEGDYEGVVALLAEVSRGPGRVAAHGCLLRLASWVTLAARTGQEELLELAAREVDACPDLEEHATLPADLFSPLVVGFLESAVRARMGPPAPSDRPLD